MRRTGRWITASLFGIPIPLFLLLPVLGITTTTCEGGALAGRELLRSGSTTATSETTMTVNGVTTVTHHSTLVQHSAFPLAWALFAVLALGVLLALLLPRHPRATVIALGAAGLALLLGLLDPTRFKSQVQVYPANGWIITFACLVVASVGNLLAALISRWRRLPPLIKGDPGT